MPGWIGPVDRGVNMGEWRFASVFSALVILAIISALLCRPALPALLASRAVSAMARTELAIDTYNWRTMDSSHFEIKYLPAQEGDARLTLEAGEAVFAATTRIMQIQPTGPIRLILYPDQASLNRSFGWPQKEGVMGVYWGGAIRLLAPSVWMDKPGLEELIRDGPMAHELAHYLLDIRARGNYPRWLTEGVAQYVERAVTGFSFGGIDKADGYSRSPFLFSTLDQEMDDPVTQIEAYRQSLAAIDLLVNRFGWDQLLVVLDSLGQGMTLNQALKSQLGISLAVWEQEFRQCYGLAA